MANEDERYLDFPLHLYHQGNNDRIYEMLGAHKEVRDGTEGYVFRVWAPHAKSVSVVGDFNGWNTRSHFMERMIDGETFELFIPGLGNYDIYKYCITTSPSTPRRPRGRAPSSSTWTASAGRTGSISKIFPKRTSSLLPSTSMRSTFSHGASMRAADTIPTANSPMSS